MEKYEDLLHTISHSITGDPSNDHKDYFNNLVLEIFPAIEAFYKKVKAGKVIGHETEINAKFEEYFHWKPFDKYIKTCLWNYKNRTGRENSFRAAKNKISLDCSIDINRGDSKLKDFVQDIDTSSLHSKLVYDNHSTIIGNFTIKQLYTTLSPRQRKIVTAILENPQVTFDHSGKINIAELSRLLKINTYKVQEEIHQLKLIIPL